MDSSNNNSRFGLILGDSHIPRRAKKIPSPLYDDIIDFVKIHGKFHKVFCTGDIVLSKEYIEFLESIDKNNQILIVQGNMDYYNGVDNPLDQKFHFNGFDEISIGLIHGHQISPRGDISELLSYAKKMGVKILISGHTHSDIIIVKDDILLLNPGSCVGAWSFMASGIPSFFIVEMNREKDNSIGLSIQTYKYGQKKEKTVTSFRFKNDEFNHL